MIYINILNFVLLCYRVEGIKNFDQEFLLYLNLKANLTSFLPILSWATLFIKLVGPLLHLQI